MFIDNIQIKVISGKGGDGLVSWRREKFIPKGGPWGGDGGKGGDIYLQTTNNLNTLSKYRNKKVLKASSGEGGGINCRHGANGEDLIIKIPIGTIVRDSKTKDIITELNKNNTKFLIAKGGKGGYGNAHFISSIRQEPRFAELGDICEEKDLLLEVKLMADIGIIGIPSSGKSTLIGSVTNVKPKIGDYPFTTIIPNLGVLEYKGKSLILEDVPGIIPGANKGKGLGIEFLKHIEKTFALLHILDIYRMDKAFYDYENIRKELELFSSSLVKKEELVVFSKADLLDKKMKDYIVLEFEKKYNKKAFVISAVTGEGLEKLKNYLIDNFSVKQEIVKDKNEELKIYDLKDNNDSKKIDINYLGDLKFKVTGERLEQIVRMTDFENKEAVMRVYDVLEKMGIIKRIEKKLTKLYKDSNLDNSFFFEGNKDSEIKTKIIIGNKEISLDKLKYNL